MKHSRIFISILIVFISGFAVASLFDSHSDFYKKYESVKYGFIPYYSTIDKKCSAKDRETAMETVSLAGEIMTDISSSVPDGAGELKIYSLREAKAERVDAKINLITASFTFSNGYMWVEYTQEVFDGDDEKIDEKTRLAYWKLKKTDGQWTVTRIKEVEV